MHWMLMPLRRYADFSGRSRRLEFWMFMLFQALLYCALAVAFVAMAGAAFTGNDLNNAAAAGIGFLAVILIFVVLWLALLVPNVAVSVRRLHDSNRSGWWFGGYFLVSFALNAFTGVAMAGIGSAIETPDAAVAAMGSLFGLASLGLTIYAFALFVFYCLDGTPGANRYGPDPKGRADASAVFA